MTMTHLVGNLLKNAEKKTRLEVLQSLYLARFTDEKMQKLVRQNKGGTFHLYTAGHELIGILCGKALTAGKDWGLPYYRDRAFSIGLGCDLGELFGAFLARAVPHHSGGRMMPDHFSHKELRIPCQSSVVGSQFLQAVGIAKGARLAQTNEVVYVSGGDGSTSQGDFHEALNYACLHRLSVLFVIQDNGWAISVPVKDQTAGGSIAQIAQGYAGLSVHAIDGCDYTQITQALKAAIDKGRALEGPSLIVAKIPRIGAHSSSDDPKKYKTDQDIAEDHLQDPVVRFEKEVLTQGILAEEDLKEIRQAMREEVEKAAAKGEAFPPPKQASILNHLYIQGESKAHETPSQRGESLVMMDAIHHALDEEMQMDTGVIVFGQDVAHGKGGVFGITRGLTEKYGVDRCFNTPLAESTIVGTAIGLALHSHFKPVAEIQFVDYLWTGLNQLCNELASFHYRSNGEWHCPIVLRIPSGAYIQGGPYHSQNMEGLLAHCPGLKVVMPSHAADAKMLLKSAIRDPNPVIFLEHKALYRQRVFAARPEPTKDEILPLGKAAVVREGTHVTLIAWGLMVCMGFEVAQKLANEGISVEVIDLRTLIPLDMATILQSVEKTNKVLILHEAPLTCGFGGEVAAQIAEKGFTFLDAPIRRLGGLDICVPYAKCLEDAALPQKEDIERALRALAQY